MAEQRLPIVDGDDGEWGDILNQYLEKEHYNTGSDNASNGGHQKITVRPGTTSAGSAPLKFTSGPLMTAAEAGSVEFLTDKLYFTQTTGTTRKTIAAYDDGSGAEGDIYYRDSSANFVRLARGSNGEVLKLASGLPSWDPEVTDATITTTDVTTNNASTSKHGWFPKLPTASGKFLRDDMSWQNVGSHTPTAVWGDGIETTSVSVGSISYVRVPYSGTITAWHIIASTSCTTAIDIWKANDALPTVLDTITASAKPGLTSASTATSSTLTGWTTSVSAGDVFGFSLDSLTGSPTSITLTMNVENA
jgi:hypothetical protein